MTYRERRVQKAERLTEWADKRRKKSAAAFSAALAIGDMIPMGQPILVGHHSEKRHRRDISRIDRAMGAGVEHNKTADRMESRAENIERALDQSIYDDDPDAIERLEAKLAKLEAQRKQYKAYNKTHVTVEDEGPPHRTRWSGAPVGEVVKKAKGTVTVRFGDGTEETVASKRCCVALSSYVLQNLGGTITRTRQRLDGLKRKKQIIETRTEREAGGATIAPAANGWSAYVDVSHPWKPSRDVIEELKAAGFRWVGSDVCWRGPEDKLPACYRDEAA